MTIDETEAPAEILLLSHHKSWELWLRNSAMESRGKRARKELNRERLGIVANRGVRIRPCDSGRVAGAGSFIICGLT